MEGRFQRIVHSWKKNRIFIPMVRKIERKEANLVARTDSPSMPAYNRPSKRWRERDPLMVFGDLLLVQPRM